MWKNININRNLIIAETGKSVLIAMPHNSDFDGFSFWHPSKLVRDGRNSGAVSIGYSDDFTFHLKKYGKGKYNSREVLDEVQLACDEFEEVFGVINENITAPKHKNDYETHKPSEIEAVGTKADDSLIDNE